MGSNGLTISLAGELGCFFVLSSGSTIMVTSLDPAGVVGGVSDEGRSEVETLEVGALEVEALVAEPVVCSNGLTISLAGELGRSSVVSSGSVVMLSEWSIPVEGAGDGSGRWNVGTPSARCSLASTF